MTMNTKLTMAVVATLSMLGASTAALAETGRPAEASAASKLSIVAPARAGAKSGKKNEAIGTGIIIAIVAAAAVTAGIIIASDDSSSN